VRAQKWLWRRSSLVCPSTASTLRLPVGSISLAHGTRSATLNRSEGASTPLGASCSSSRIRFAVRHHRSDLPARDTKQRRHSRMHTHQRKRLLIKYGLIRNRTTENNKRPESQAIQEVSESGIRLKHHFPLKKTRLKFLYFSEADRYPTAASPSYSTPREPTRTCKAPMRASASSLAKVASSPAAHDA
jgi:hypothetical protein